MKKSTIYHKAAMAVMNDTLLGFTFEEKLAAIQQLMEDEKLAAFIEERDEKEGAL